MLPRRLYVRDGLFNVHFLMVYFDFLGFETCGVVGYHGVWKPVLGNNFTGFQKRET
jgi:hypothetical protein